MGCAEASKMVAFLIAITDLPRKSQSLLIEFNGALRLAQGHVDLSQVAPLSSFSASVTKSVRNLQRFLKERPSFLCSTQSP